MSNAQRSFGTKLSYSSDSGSTFTAVSGATKIGFPAPEIDEIEVTNHDSTGGYREFLAGLKDAGSVDFEGEITAETVVSGLTTLFNANTVVSWKIEIPQQTGQTAGATWTFDAYLSKFGEGDAEIDSARTYTGTLRVTGQPTYTAATTA